MRLSAFFNRERLFAWVIGPVDGILTALTLAAGHIMKPHQPIEQVLAARIAGAAALSGGFVFFVAEYARLRGELSQAERHLSLATHGQLALSALGRKVLFESLQGTGIAALSGFLGALVPLSLGAAFPDIAWMGIAAAIGVLGLLGATVARVVHGASGAWAVALMAGGVALSVAGVWLDIT